MSLEDKEWEESPKKEALFYCSVDCMRRV